MISGTSETFSNDLQLSLSPANHHADHPPLRPPLPRVCPSSSGNIQTRRKYFNTGVGSMNVGFVDRPFPWATNCRAHVCSLAQLLQRDIRAVTGEVQCKRCEARYEIEYALESKFEEVMNYIAQNKATMRDRPPAKWISPTLPSCQKCHQPNCAKPVISPKKKSINWLFLFLGGMLGCCTLEQLKYFCKHTHNHRTGARDRVLYLTYLALCKQLAGSDDESGLFDP